MAETERLRRELRATREELVCKQAEQGDGETDTESRLPLMPDREEAFLRLALMNIDDLETHIERLERDLKDLEGSVQSRQDIQHGSQLVLRPVRGPCRCIWWIGVPTTFEY